MEPRFQDASFSEHCICRYVWLEYSPPGVCTPFPFPIMGAGLAFRLFVCSWSGDAVPEWYCRGVDAP